MVVTLSIELKNDFFCMESTYAQTCVKGYLLLNYNNNGEEENRDIHSHDILHNSSTCIHINGKEWIAENEDDTTILIDDTYHLSTLEWQHHPENKCFTIPFDIPLPRDLPITFIGEDSGIDYMIRANIRRTLNNPPLAAARPLILLRGPPSPSSTHSSSSSLTSLISPLPSLSSSSSLLSSTSVPPSSSSLFSAFFKSYPSSTSSSSLNSIDSVASNRSRLCWGMSTQSQWQYELELPQLIDASQPFSLVLRTRMRRPSLSKRNSSMESCMIGIQVFESVHVGFKPSNNQVLMTTSHVLTEPSKTWSNPWVVPLELNQLPKSSTLMGSRIKVKHHCQITLDYCSAEGQSDRVHIDCIIPMITLLSSSHFSTLPHPLLDANEEAVNTLMGMITKQTDRIIDPLWLHPTSEFTSSI